MHLDLPESPETSVYGVAMKTMWKGRQRAHEHQCGFEQLP